MKKLAFLILILGTTIQLSNAQKSFLQSGPMLGHIDMKEAWIWVQTNASAEVKVAYYPIAKPEEVQFTTPTQTEEQHAFTAKLLANRIVPGTRYRYDLYINNQKITLDYPTEFSTQMLWQHRTDPPDFKMVIGSCTYINDSTSDRPGKPYGGDYRIFESIHQKKANIMLWLGDNIYLRRTDWATKTGIFYRYTHLRSLPQLQPLLASMPHYAIWDDHDFGPNDGDRSFINKPLTLEAFKTFWANPSYGLDNLKGITSQFSYNDVDVFLLDNRYHRTPLLKDSTQRYILGNTQVEWLIDALKFSKARYKLVAIGGQVLNTAAVHENYARFPQERDYLLKRITEEEIRGVIFLTGDRHHTELSQLKTDSGNTIYDLTVSPLTSTAHKISEQENNKLMVPQTMVAERNFGVLSFSGTYSERVLKITIFNSDGKALWNYTINASDL